MERIKVIESDKKEGGWCNVQPEGGVMSRTEEGEVKAEKEKRSRVG